MGSSSSFEKGRQPVTSFQIRVATNLAEFSGLWPRTDDRGRAHGYAFQCADIVEVWCDTIGKARRTQTFFVAVYDDVGQPMLLLPLGIERHRGVRILSFLDGGVCDYNAPIVFEPTRAWEQSAVEQMWRKLITALPPFDIAILDKMPARVCSVANPFITLGTPSPPFGHLVNITTAWDEYATKRLPYKKETSYQRRRLGKSGHVKFIVAETTADRRRLLEAMISQKSRRYIETRGVDGLDRPGYRHYYTALAERLAGPGPLLMSALEVDGAILATNWGFLSEKRFAGIVMSFEGGEWKSYSPGRILLEDLLKWNFTHGNSVFDFGVGDEPYKVAYTDETLELYEAVIPVTVAGKFYEAAQNSTLWKYLRTAKAQILSKMFNRSANRNST